MCVSHAVAHACTSPGKDLSWVYIFIQMEPDASPSRCLQVYGAGVWASLALMCASALCGSITDLAFDLEGYLWQLVNCLFTASYSLYLRGVMDRVVALTVNKTRLDEFSMVRTSSYDWLPIALSGPCMA